MDLRNNVLKTVRYEKPDYIPMTFHINDSCWQNYPQDYLFELMESHRFLFPDFQRPETVYRPDFSLVARKDQPFTDDFGCVWETTEDGITGTVTKHPLKDWASFQNYKFPDPGKYMGIGPVDWDSVKEQYSQEKRNSVITKGGLRHGHTFLQMCDLRGYENLIFDMTDDEPNLKKLIFGIEEFNSSIIDKYIDIGVEMMLYPEDLGMQNGPMISPEHFRKYIKPSYQRLMTPARRNGVIVHMHSDGYIHDLLDDIIDGGVDVINLQDLVNGIDWIADRLAGKVCVEIDIDRQSITARGDPGQIDSLIYEEVKKLGRKEGGLMMIYGLYPGIPLENIKAVMDAMEKYSLYFT